METVTIQQTPSRASGASAFCRISVSRWMISMPIITHDDLEPLIARLEDLRDEISRNIEKLKEHSKGHNDLKSDR